MRFAVLAGAVLALAPYAAHAAVEDDLRDGDKYFEDGDWARAAIAFDRAIAKAPSQVPAEAYGKRAAIFIIQRDYVGGLAFVDKAKLRYPAAPEVLEQEALLLFETDQKAKAVAIAERVVAVRPRTFTNQQLIGEYYATRDPQKTAKAYEAYLAARPAELEAGDTLPRIRLGFAYLANARVILGEGGGEEVEARAATAYTRAVEQFDVVQKKFGKKPNAQTNADNGLCAAYAGLGRFDQAVTVCERVIGDPTHIDPSGSVWFNLGTAYLARKQTQKARGAATEFTRMRKSEARGYILLGDTFYADRQWTAALEQYLRGEKLLRPTQPRDQIQLSIRLGKTYLRLPVAAGTRNPNIDLAIDKLQTAAGANPRSLELAIELGNAYVEAHLDAKAIALADRLLLDTAAPRQVTPVDQRVELLAIAGKGQYNTRKLKDARARFEAAQKLRPADITIQRDLVLVINEQALEATDGKAAQALLDQALAVDGSSPVTLTNVAILAIGRGDCEVAQKQLTRLESINGHDAVLRARLAARAALCVGKPDLARASEAYATAEALAKKANATMTLAEIYVEWAPLLYDTDLAGAVEKLEYAVQAGGQETRIVTPAKRNLALALYRRGWRALKDGKSADAVADLERAFRDGVLKGTEPLAFEFSLALAQLDAGRAAEAGKAFRALAQKGSLATYLRPPYAKVGPQLLAAYASYRTGSLAARQQAAADFTRLATDLPGAKIEELIAGCWESIAFEQWRNGQVGAAQRSLAAAATHVTNQPELDKRLRMDRLALALDKRQLAALESLQGSPPEVLVNLGIVLEQLGRPREAYDAWLRAKARGVQSRDLQKWIDAKKRIYGY
ncbi:MAG: tetratricopeptide repeat protein [Proteobacteria bacterium]|nr:tetratricopeptide repeat protein [Pseudomonadota bacterium]